MLKNKEGIIEIELKNDGIAPVIQNIRHCILASGQFTEPVSTMQIDSAIVGAIRLKVIKGTTPLSQKVLNKFLPFSNDDYWLYTKQKQLDHIEWHIDLSIGNMSNLFWEVGAGEWFQFEFFVKAYPNASDTLRHPFNADRDLIQRIPKPHEFLKMHQLEMAVYKDELKQVREILKELNRDYVLNHTEEKESKVFRNQQRYIFRVHCPTTNFAMAFLMLGVKMNPIYVQRAKKDKKNRSKK